jgi:hypothetical protein
MRNQFFAFVLVLLCAGAGFADSGKTNSTLEVLAHNAVSADAAESTAAIEELRSRGPQGLDSLLGAYVDEVKRRREGASTSPSVHWQVIASAIDRVAAQRDAYASGLYWYTDLDQAKAAARESGKPILSLRLLGRLDEELSCANSRFFRITLYANTEISRVLRERFILHWESVRPVPKVTIDFGDGRKLERTLTGNSIHYVLDSDGSPIDAIPGLYGPAAFLRELQQADQLASSLRSAKRDLERDAVLRSHHQGRLRELSTKWSLDLANAGVVNPPRRDLTVASSQDNPPRAEIAAPRAVSKALVERPLLRRTSSTRSGVEATSEDEEWARIGRLYAQDARLDDASLTLMRNKNRATYGAPGTTGAFQQAVINLERAIAEDTARNRYTFETTLHQWFAAGTLTKDLRALNEKIYSELFLTPSSDRWLGLLPADSYNGIENEGVGK